MLIKDIMSKPVITVKPGDSAFTAYKLMQEHKIRRLPVLDSHRLVGIVTERDIREARPSAVTHLPENASLDILRITEIKQIMAKDVVTVISDDPVEQAALLMIQHKIGGIPVMEKGHLVGIITETDIFRLFATMFGAEPGYFQVVLVNSEETRAGVVDAFHKFSKQVRSILFSPKYPEIVMVFKISDRAETQKILDELHRFSFQILDWHYFESGSPVPAPT